jgi:succinyl-CoA synthetase alpha subunit
MAILANKQTRLIVQGITGREGDFHARQMHSYSGIVVGGVTPGKGGMELDYDGSKIPVFDTVGEAMRKTGANASVIYVPAKFAADAVMEAADAGVPLIVCITEGIPVLDMVKVRAYLDAKGGSLLLGPNCPGLLTPGEAKIGIIPANIATPGKVGIVSRSGTLTYEAVDSLTRAGMGQSTIIGIGGDPVRGLNFLDVVKMFNDDPDTDAIVMIGEIGGSDEEVAAEWIKNNVKKPVAGFIAGLSAPEGKRMGHAGAIIEGGKGTAQSKMDAMNAAGIKVATLVTQLPELLKQAMAEKAAVARLLVAPGRKISARAAATLSKKPAGSGAAKGAAVALIGGKAKAKATSVTLKTAVKKASKPAAAKKLTRKPAAKRAAKKSAKTGKR